MAIALPLPALFVHDSPQDDPVWRAALAAPYMPLPAEIEAEALAAYEEAEQFVRSGRRGARPDDIQALIATMRDEQGDDDVGA